MHREPKYRSTTMGKYKAKSEGDARIPEDGEKLFQTIFEKSRNPIAIIDFCGRYLDANQAFVDFVETGKTRLLQMEVFDFFPPKRRDTQKQNHGILWESGGTIETEYWINGRIKVLELTIAPISYMGRDSVIGIGRDITDRKLAEQELRESQDLLKATEQLAKVGGWQWDVLEETMAWTDETYRIHGFSPQEIANGSPELVQRSIACYDPEDRPVVEKAFHRCVEKGEPYDLELPFTTADGRRIWIQTMARPVKEGHRIVKVQGHVMDITERKTTEQTLRFLAESAGDSPEALFRSMARNMASLQGARYGLVARIDPHDLKRAHTVAVWAGEGFADNFTYTLEGTPCCNVATKGSCFYPAGIQQRFPEDHLLSEMGAESYWGTPIRNSDKRVIGVVAVIDTKPMPEEPRTLSLLNTVAARIGSEMERLETAQRYQTLFREMMEGFSLHEIICDGQGKPVDYRFLSVNPAFERMTGLKADGIAGKTVREVLPDTESHWIDTYGRVAQTGEPVSFENYAKNLDRHFKVTAFQPAPNQFASIFFDITERKRAEEELRFQAMLLDQISDRITATDLEGNITYSNQAETVAMQRSREELIGQNVRTFGEDPSRGASQQEIIDSTLEKGGWSGEVVNFRPDGSEMLMHWRTQLFKDESGEPAGIIGIATDITAQKRAESALQESQKKYRQLVELAPNLVAVHRDGVFVFINTSKETEYEKIIVTAIDGFWVIDTAGCILTVNPAAAAMLGYTQAEMTMLTVNDIDALEDGEATRQHMEALALRGSARFETLHKRKDGSLLDVEVSASFLPVGEGRFIAFMRDISARKKAERENEIHKMRVEIAQKMAILPNAGEKELCDFVLERMLQLSDSPIGFLGYLSEDEQTMQIHSWSSKVMDHCQIDDKPISFLIEEAGLWGEPIRQRKPLVVNDYGALHPAKKGYPEGHVEIARFMAVPVFDGERIVAIAAVGNKKNLYETVDARQLALLMDSWWEQVRRKRMAEEEEKIKDRLQSIQKMEAIGNLAGGIAHDFNNLLFPIIGMSELVLEDLSPESETHENVLEILKAGKRGSDLVKQILAFSRQSESDLVPVRFQQVTKEVLKLCRATIPSNIEIKQNIQIDCGPVLADSTQLHQIAMNLVTNAYHAVEASGGNIFVQLAEKELAEKDLGGTSLTAGRYAVMSVFDTGAGIAPAIKEKIFEPYFTTKEKGKGTGLGLAVVYGIVKEYGGDIRLKSEVGKGTTFEVFLPLIQKESDMPETTISKTKAETGTERILLVDDEEPIANLEKQMLERLGYLVSVRHSSIDALDAFKATPDEFDLLVTDMTMPAMTGDQLAREFIAIRPDFPVIVCTGFSERINAQIAEAIGIKGFLMKPVIRKDLAALVRKVLDETKTQSGEFFK